MSVPRRPEAMRAASVAWWLIATIFVAACAGRGGGAPDTAIAASGFPLGTYTKSFVEPTYGPSTLAWTFGADGRWAEIPLKGAPVGAKPIRGTFRVDGDLITITTNYPPGFGTSRHTWQVDGDSIRTRFQSSDFEEDAAWFAMLDPVPWTRLR